MTSEIDQVKKLLAQDEVPAGVSAGVDMAWAIHRRGNIPNNYLICREALWDKICKLLKFIPAHVRSTGKDGNFISFSLDEIRR